MRRSAVTAVLGSETVRDREAYVSAVFDTLTALTSACRFDPSFSLIALQARNDAISNAWKPEVAKVGSLAVRAATSWLDAESMSYLTEPRDDDGKWTAVESRKLSPDVGSSSSIGGSSIGGYDLSANMKASGHIGNPERSGAAQPTMFASVSPVGTRFAEKIQIAYSDGWRACHEKCLQETEHIKSPDRPLAYVMQLLTYADSKKRVCSQA